MHLYLLVIKAYVARFESTFNVTTDGSNLGRIYVWEADKKMIMDHPVTGVGPGLWQKHIESTIN